MANRSPLRPRTVAIAIVAVLLGIVALPDQYKWWAPAFLRSPTLHFGLDLAGGTQLDFRVSEHEIQQQLDATRAQLSEARQNGSGSDAITRLQIQEQALEDQRRNVLEAIRLVLERRINALGVSEAVITPSYVGDEKHLLVECPGVIDVQQCIDTVGKTISLEFKEEFTEPTAEFQDGVRAQVAAALARITQSGETLTVVAQDLNSELGVFYTEEQGFYQAELPVGLEDAWNQRPENGVRQYTGMLPAAATDSAGNPTQQLIPGTFLVEATRPRSPAERPLVNPVDAFPLLASGGVVYESHTDIAVDDQLPTAVRSALPDMQPGETKVIETGGDSARVIALQSFVPGGERMTASHIVVAYAGAQAADASITRTKEEAKAIADAALVRVRGGEDFAAVAAAVSDGSSKDNGGELGELARGDMPAQFETVAFALEQGAISDVAETPFGFHIIRADEAAHRDPDTTSYEELVVSGENAESRAEALLSRFENGEVTRTEEQISLRTLFFSLVPTGWKDTALDGKHFRAATVTLDGVTNIPVVQITFDEEGGRIFEELTANNIGKQIAIFVGGQLISAPTVQNRITGGTAVITGSRNIEDARALAQDLNTGAIPAPIYLSGQHTVEATLGAEALRTSIWAAAIGIIVLMVYMVVMYRGLGLVADIALAIYAVLFFAILKLPLFLFSGQYIVLTLAGMAGIILSIGMAIDANVLIFERIKEELKKGKQMKTAVSIGFERAWPSIRDGNVSTFITCVILFLIGTSIVRGFAVTLSMGVLLSMFTAIIVTRWMLNYIAGTKLAEKTKLFSA